MTQPPTKRGRSYANVTLPPSLHAWIKEEIVGRDFRTPSQYMRHLVERDMMGLAAERLGPPHALLAESLQAFLDGDVERGKALLREHVCAGIGFRELARLSGQHQNTLTRALGRGGNPRIDVFFGLIRLLADTQGLSPIVDVPDPQATGGTSAEPGKPFGAGRSNAD
ncbi:MAG: hypothetical protein H6843_00955 [Rhodospirillaceae bacterium]|nr:hypothetical protein [Rhodospirillaceae bacterium]